MVLWYKQTFEDRTGIKYQEVMANPTFGDTIANVRMSNWGYVAAWTAVGAVTGFAYGTHN